jgi:predicted kinase
MDNVCAHCGLYRADKPIDPAGPDAVCPECGHRHRFIQGPLLLVAGASGSGKSTVCRLLLGAVTEAVLLDADILWRPEFDDPETGYRDFFETWLRLSKNIAQSGRPAVIFGAGFGVPANVEPCVERRYFANSHYLALTCSATELRDRLRRRSAWRGANRAAFIEQQLRFNDWFKRYDAMPRIELLDTTQTAATTTAAQVAAWVRARLQTTVDP